MSAVTDRNFCLRAVLKRGGPFLCYTQRVGQSDKHSDLIGCDLAWHRDAADWVLRHNKRRMGRVVADREHPGMWRSAKSGGRLSDMANLSWSKNAVLETATRELEWEARHRPVITPPKPQQIAPAFESGPPRIRFPATAGSTLPSSL